jgi:hypothetical protein
MGWATSHIEKLKQGETVKFRPRGNSMQGKVESGQLVTVAPLADEADIAVGDIVLCKVKGNQYLHLVKALRGNEVQIGNNKGFINGWASRRQIFGRLVSVED